MTIIFVQYCHHRHCQLWYEKAVRWWIPLSLEEVGSTKSHLIGLKGHRDIMHYLVSILIIIIVDIIIISTINTRRTNWKGRAFKTFLKKDIVNIIIIIITILTRSRKKWKGRAAQTSSVPSRRSAGKEGLLQCSVPPVALFRYRFHFMILQKRAFWKILLRMIQICWMDLTGSCKEDSWKNFLLKITMIRIVQPLAKRIT